ncbi:MAG TPA: hypothetical protein VG963_10890, partial [Polyangiaceae bacterium]|nr:hypothetical protein [Polyangiaceae bacterium]
MTRKLGIRWTIGDVSGRGFEALRLAVWGAYGIFGDRASYAVCVNSLPLAVAQARTGAVPESLRWVDANAALPSSLRPYFGSGMAQGTAWKLAPLRLFPNRHELSLDNDCVLWALPDALSSWLADEDEAVLMAEDVRACCGSFAKLCGGAPRNLGIRGLPPRFDL